MPKKDINCFSPCRKGTDDIFISSEKRCKHIGKNSDENYIRQYRVDGEVYTSSSEGERCDYLLLDDTIKKSFFIELKGSDIHKAINQIETSIQAIKESIPDYEILPRIIYTSGSHKVLDSTVTKWKAKHSGKAIVKAKVYEEKI